jgi:hypothetical protein
MRVGAQQKLINRFREEEEECTGVHADLKSFDSYLFNGCHRSEELL